MKKILIVILALATWSACKKVEYQLYEGDDFIRFNRMYTLTAAGGIDAMTVSYWDTFTLNFRHFASTDTSIYIDLASNGSAHDVNRSFAFADSSLAVFGEHYTVVNRDSTFIGTSDAYRVLEVKLHRNELYTDSVYDIDLWLHPNENFRTDLVGNINPLVPQISESNYYHRTLHVVDSLTKPYNWDEFASTLGTFSSLKLRTFVKTIDDLKVINFFNQPWTEGISYNTPQLAGYAKSFQDSLYKWQEENRPKLEKSGALMKMGVDVL